MIPGFKVFFLNSANFNSTILMLLMKMAYISNNSNAANEVVNVLVKY